MRIDLTLLHTNDMHNRRTVFPFLEAYERPPASLLLDAGDAIRGSNTVFHFYEPMLELMSRVGYDAMTMGNREFHYLRGVLGRRYKQVSFPFVCANLYDLRNKTNHMWQPTLVKRVAGITVGIIGLTPVQYPAESLWQPLTGFRFLPPMEVLPKCVAELRSQVDLIVLLSHSGFDADCTIARLVDGIDVIVGGHSHTLLEMPRCIAGTHIVQTGSYGRYVGRMNLRITAGSSVEVTDYQLIPMQGVASNDEMAERGGAA